LHASSSRGILKRQVVCVVWRSRCYDDDASQVLAKDSSSGETAYGAQLAGSGGVSRGRLLGDGGRLATELLGQWHEHEIVTEVLGRVSVALRDELFYGILPEHCQSPFRPVTHLFAAPGHARAATATSTSLGRSLQARGIGRTTLSIARLHCGTLDALNEGHSIG
jgi:hypothetical protein